MWNELSRLTEGVDDIFVTTYSAGTVVQSPFYHAYVIVAGMSHYSIGTIMSFNAGIKGT